MKMMLQRFSLCLIGEYIHLNVDMPNMSFQLQFTIFSEHTIFSKHFEISEFFIDLK